LGKAIDREAPLRQGQRYCTGSSIKAGRCSLKRSRSVTAKTPIA